MIKKLISTEASGTIALVGISKNSGKTTLLNAILAEDPDENWAVISTGLDGESQDRIYKSPKPSVLIPENSYFCTDSLALSTLGSKVSILDSQLYSGRKLWYLKAEEDLETEITGPSNVSQQIEMTQRMRALGARRVLIDGSLDRKSIAFEPSVDSIVLLIGASFGSIESVVQELKRLEQLIALPLFESSKHISKRLLASAKLMYQTKGRWRASEFESLFQSEVKMQELLSLKPDKIYIPSAYSSLVHKRIFSALKESPAELIFRHPQALALTYKELLTLIKAKSPKVLIPFKVKLFALNPWAVGQIPQDANLYRDKIRRAFPHLKFLDIMELQP